MEMQRLNENTIRVLLGNDDLAERGITVLDLLGNHKQIENFFYSILDEVDKDHTFATNDAVTFQVMPSQSGLELLISRNVDLGEDDDNDDVQDDAPADDGDQDVPDFIKQQLRALDDDTTNEAVDEGGYIDGDGAAQEEFVLRFGSFEDFVALAKQLRLDGAASDLYQYKNDYYLVLTFYTDHVSADEAQDQLALALEFGDRTNISAALLSEYGKSIMATSALETARYYFK
ncbi:adaptor protein MecA [Lacticaseibacillus mingshuiensis]|uniref:Adapter protein MecA n=1 Tax=Lacticaseibacillus mingshuiensis TaxID=2799574 RepID=A0ABW4CF19_9LACO|nr:adaptor protein MecA [Lacticaseibacillus mingshuiensis]